MDSRNDPAPHEELTDAEYFRLEAILDSFPSEQAMDIEEMDGFFAALISGTVTVSPAACLDEVFGGKTTPLANRAELQEFLDLVMRHWNSIAVALISKDKEFAPLLMAEGEEVPRGNSWARGFMRAVALYQKEWQEIFEDEDRMSMLLPVLALAHEHDRDEEMRTWKTPPGDELRKTVLAGLAVATQEIYDYFLRRRAGKVAERGITGQAGKMGRNDPCYCGSGKKYKRCCGNVTVN